MKTMPWRTDPLWGSVLSGILLVAAPVLAEPTVVTLDSKAPLVEIKVMVKAGSADDPPGKEGLAALTAAALIDGGFTSPSGAVSKERLAELVRPWGAGAQPRVSVSKETTTFSFTVPREVLPRYLETVLGPLLVSPLFDAKELERLRVEALQGLRSGLRLERIEDLGLVALDAVIHEGTSYAHPDGGTEKGLCAVTRDDILAFYRARYRQNAIILGLGSADATLKDRALGALRGLEADAGAQTQANAPGPPVRPEALIITMPGAIASGIHAGFPLTLGRRHPDFWPLYVANVWFGAHRDGFSHLYEVIREERGYNYGDYSYIEHFEGRPYLLFPPFNTPRRHQYFSIWVRPVAHRFAPHLARAITWELEQFARRGLTPEQCALAKNKAKALYLSLAETTERLLASRLDDAFYGLDPGYLPSYLKSVEAVSCERINAAIKTHLLGRPLKYVVVTSPEEAPKLAKALSDPAPAWGKGPADYQIDALEKDGVKTYLVTEPKLELLRRDAAWAHHPLDLAPSAVRVVPAQMMFETAALPR